MEATASDLSHYGLPGLLIGVIVLVLWWLLTRTIPGMLKTFQATVAEERAAWKEEIGEERKTCERRHKDLATLVKEGNESQQDAHQQTRHRLAGIEQTLGIAAAVRRAREEGKAP